MHDFEKLGLFYLGRRRDLRKGKTTDELVLYDSRDLTTHAVVVGMTGSGKTGLCVTMLEEAALDRIPSIVIDPKGDISNLLLTFPDLSPQEFQPWVDESQAQRSGMTIEQYAAAEAKRWTDGLAEWGQDGLRIRTLRETVELRVYTPGSSAGRPLAILKRFSAPSPEVLEHPDLFRERIAAAATSLLGLIGVEADPLRSREHILISKLLESAWSAGKDMDMARLIREIQTPPIARIGVMELDQFFPSADRAALAMALNQLMASPTFASWMQGEPLQVKRLLHTDDGRPCVSIMSISHLSDPQRMFFVTVLLNEVLSWMRGQSGTTSLRAILFMDEVFGYFPPTANPPAKLPMLTLLKQARAYGLGIVLATQNPVDLDYKGLSNAGTWFLGRLQTERDKLRVLEGLEGASVQTGSSFDRSEMDAILSGLGNRIFVMNNAHEDHPVVFETRWAMSYLRGPLTRAQIEQLGQATASTAETTAPSETGPVESAEVVLPTTRAEGDARSTLPADIRQVFAVITRPTNQLPVVYHPALLGGARLYYSQASDNIDVWLQRNFIVTRTSDSMPDDVWEIARPLESLPEWCEEPESNAEFAAVPQAMQRRTSYTNWERQFPDFLYREQQLVIWKCAELKATSQPGESEGDFRVRLEQLASEKRDRDVDALRKKYAPKYQLLDDRIRRAESKVEREKEQYQQRRLDSILSVGSTILGAVLGRKKLSATNVSKASTSVRSMGRAAAQRDDIGRATDEVEVLQEKKAELESEFEAAVNSLAAKLNVASLTLEEARVRPRKSDIRVLLFGIAWLPYTVDSAGTLQPAWG